MSYENLPNRYAHGNLWLRVRDRHPELFQHDAYRDTTISGLRTATGPRGSVGCDCRVCRVQAREMQQLQRAHGVSSWREFTGRFA